MKIIWHSNAPWCNSAYGQQTALFAPLIASLGHDVVISAYHGLQGAPADWQGIRVLPGSVRGDDYGGVLLGEHLKHEHADLIVTLMDPWALPAEAIRPLPVAHWMPVDCSPLSVLDMLYLQASGAETIAMSRFGQARLDDAGFSPLYVPHGLHPAFTGDLPDPAEAKRRFGVEGRFTVGMNAANKDGLRKGFWEQLSAFAQLHDRHADTVLMLHTRAAEDGALDLLSMARTLGIEDAVRFPDQYAYTTGQLGVDYLLDWYRALDLYSGCSMGEGFGIPLIEAQACGVPVVATDASAMTELCGAGWLVGGEPLWNGMHRACWKKPDATQILRVYLAAYTRGPEYTSRQAAAAGFAAAYEPVRILHEYWKPALETLQAGP